MIDKNNIFKLIKQLKDNTSQNGLKYLWELKLLFKNYYNNNSNNNLDLDFKKFLFFFLKTNYYNLYKINKTINTYQVNNDLKMDLFNFLKSSNYLNNELKLKSIEYIKFNYNDNIIKNLFNIFNDNIWQFENNIVKKLKNLEGYFNNKIEKKIKNVINKLYINKEIVKNKYIINFKNLIEKKNKKLNYFQNKIKILKIENGKYIFQKKELEMEFNNLKDKYLNSLNEIKDLKKPHNLITNKIFLSKTSQTQSKNLIINLNKGIQANIKPLNKFKNTQTLNNIIITNKGTQTLNNIIITNNSTQTLNNNIITNKGTQTVKSKKISLHQNPSNNYYKNITSSSKNIQVNFTNNLIQNNLLKLTNNKYVQTIWYPEIDSKRNWNLNSDINNSQVNDISCSLINYVSNFKDIIYLHKYQSIIGILKAKIVTLEGKLLRYEVNYDNLEKKLLVEKSITMSNLIYKEKIEKKLYDILNKPDISLDKEKLKLKLIKHKKKLHEEIIEKISINQILDSKNKKLSSEFKKIKSILYNLVEVFIYFSKTLFPKMDSDISKLVENVENNYFKSFLNEFINNINEMYLNLKEIYENNNTNNLSNPETFNFIFMNMIQEIDKQKSLNNKYKHDTSKLVDLQSELAKLVQEKFQIKEILKKILNTKELNKKEFSSYFYIILSIIGLKDNNKNNLNNFLFF